MIDHEALAWAIRKLTAFGVANNTAENAHMMDRLESMFREEEQAYDSGFITVQDFLHPVDENSDLPPNTIVCDGPPPF